MRWIIGDIHGMLKPLAALVAAVKKTDPAARFFFVGDYVNRGPDAKGVLDLLLSLEGACFARGNHDDIFDIVLNGNGYAPDGITRIMAFQWFMKHGLAETLGSYNMDEAELEFVESHPSDSALAKLMTAIPARHRQFVRDLPPVIEEDDLFVAHALWPAQVPTEGPGIAGRLDRDLELRRNIVWGRYAKEDIKAKKAWKRRGYFGHTPVDLYRPGGDFLPIAGEKMVLLDTAAALTPTGRLTAFCADTGKFLQSDRAGDVSALQSLEGAQP